MNQELINWLKKIFGLNSYEAEVYLILLKYKKLSPAEIGKISKTPRTRVYDIIDSLIKKGLVKAIIEDEGQTKYIPTLPEDYIDYLKKETELEFIEKVLWYEKIKETKEFEELKKILENNRINISINTIFLLKGTRRIYYEIYKLINKHLEKEIIITSDSNKEILSLVDYIKNLKIFKKKEGKIIIVGNNIEIDKNILKLLEPWEVQIINIKQPIGRFVIIDNKVGIIFLKFKKDIINEISDYCIISYQKGIITPLRKLIEYIK